MAVAGFMATTISERGRRAVKPSALRRMVYQVGRPWMLDGNRFLPLTGMPILNSARSRAVLAVWLPEPFLVATMMANMFTTGGRSTVCGPPCTSLIAMLIFSFST